jgi:hypothetical protein
VDGRRVRIDLGREPAVPDDDDAAGLVDLVNDATIALAQTGVVARSLDELDPRPDRHSGPKAGGEKSCALGVHRTHIGFVGQRL